MNAGLIASLTVFAALLFIAGIVIVGGGARTGRRRKFAAGPVQKQTAA